MDPSLSEVILEEYMQLPRYFWPTITPFMLAIAGKYLWGIVKKKTGKKKK